MSNEEALEQLKINGTKEPLEISENPTRMANYFKALDIASQALEKQIAKKVIKQSTDEKTHYKCNCGYIFKTVYNDGTTKTHLYTGNYCHHCGQKLDWTQEVN